MSLFQEIKVARELLELPERASMQEIKSNYRTLIRRWHPDRCNNDKETCRQMTTRIIAAYKVISAYCQNYKFSFSKEEVKRYLPAEEWWLDRFGNNPLWGSDQKPE